MTLEEALAEMRASAWMVAVHNDYRLDGRLRTFWLFTHPSGEYIKSEADTDHQALQRAVDERRAREQRRFAKGQTP